MHAEDAAYSSFIRPKTYGSTNLRIRSGVVHMNVVHINKG
jgi:hypothetical protein